jgi:thiol-disulfide isomerase/thioredoxin
LAGCSQQATEPASATPAAIPAQAAAPETPPDGQSEPVLAPVTTEVKKPEAPPANSKLKLEIIDWDQTLAIAKAHPGQSVVMDLWATYCPPCLKELPGLVKLQEKYPDQVICVSVSLDYEGDADNPPAKLAPEIRAVLERIKAHKVRNILLSTSSEDLFNQIEHKSMPVLYVFDQTGQRVGMFPDLKNPAEPTYAKDVVPLVEKLLAAPKQ